MTRLALEGRPRRALWIAAVVLMSPWWGALGGGAGPTPLATNFSGDGRVVDLAGFGIFGASVEATVWAGTGIAAGPSQVCAGAGGAFDWSVCGMRSAGPPEPNPRRWSP